MVSPLAWFSSYFVRCFFQGSMLFPLALASHVVAFMMVALGLFATVIWQLCLGFAFANDRKLGVFLTSLMESTTVCREYI